MIGAGSGRWGSILSPVMLQDEVLVFAPCSFTGANKGDAALLEATAAALHDELGPIRVISTSFTPEEDARRYGLEVLRMPLAPDGKVALQLHRLAQRGPAWGRAVAYVVLAQLAAYVAAMRVWVVLARVFPLLALAVLPTPHRSLVEVVRSARVAAAVPGGYLMAPTPAHYHWLYHVATLALCSLLRRPILLLPGSYGPFPGFHRRVAAAILSRCELVMAREQPSADHLVALGVPADRVRLVPDTAYLLPDGDGSAELDEHGLGWLGQSGRLIGVSVRRHDFPGSHDPGVAFDEYLDGVAQAMDWCVHHLEITPVFVTQVSGDEEVSAAVAARMAMAGRAVTVDADLSPFGLKALYARFELMVGTRAHANILAMAAGVPAVAISYEHKTHGIMELAGFGQYVVPVTETDRLPSVIAEAWNRRRDSRRALAEVLPTLRRAAREAPAAVAAVCRGDGEAAIGRPGREPSGA